MHRELEGDDACACAMGEASVGRQTRAARGRDALPVVARFGAPAGCRLAAERKRIDAHQVLPGRRLHAPHDVLVVATVDATLEIRPLSDTITVTAETSPLDVHGAKRELTLSDEIIRAIPTARSYNALVVLIPGVLTTSNDTVTGTATTAFPIHGGRTTEGRLLLDGLNVGSPPGGNSATSYSLPKRDQSSACTTCA